MFVWRGNDPDFAQKKNQKHFRRQNLSTISKNSQKGKRGPQRKLKFCMVKKGIISNKKAQKSDFRWGPLHGENGLLNNKYLMANICAVLRGQISTSSSRPFFRLINSYIMKSEIKKVYFVPYKYIWNIWVRIKWHWR